MGTFSDVISLWGFAFILPALWVGMGLYIFEKDCPKHVSKQTRLIINMLIIHIGLLISIGTSQYLHATQNIYFPWHLTVYTFVGLVLALTYAVYRANKLGAWYFLSSFIQQLALLSIANLLVHLTTLTITILLIVPIFAFGHWDKNLLFSKQFARICILLTWGVLCISIFYTTQNPYLPIMLHAVCGIYMIKKGVIYPELEK